MSDPLSSANSKQLAQQLAMPPGVWRREPSFGRNVALGCGAMLAAGFLFVAALFCVAGAMLRSSDAYQLAVDSASHNPTAIAELGAPLKLGWLPMGKISVSGPTGDANLAIPISGSRASGTLNACANKSAGKWQLTCLNLEVSGRPTLVELLAAAP